jgi:hypothetical protein
MTIRYTYELKLYMRLRCKYKNEARQMVGGQSVQKLSSSACAHWSIKSPLVPLGACVCSVRHYGSYNLALHILPRGVRVRVGRGSFTENRERL